MDDALLVRVIEGAGGFGGDAERVVERKPVFPAEPVAERFPLDEGHGEPELRLVGFEPGHLAGIQHGQDVRMLEAGGELDLTLEPLGAGPGGHLGQEDLEGDRAIVAEIVREIDDGHAAAAELAADGVAAGECLAKSFRRTHARAPRHGDPAAPPAMRARSTEVQFATTISSPALSASRKMK